MLSIAVFAMAASLGACGDDGEQVTCTVTVGEAATTVTFDDQVGASAVATLGSYAVTFTVLDRHGLEAEVRDSDSVLMTGTSNGVIAGGSSGTPDGQLEYSCGAPPSIRVTV
jgi:hypothetical protein